MNDEKPLRMGDEGWEVAATAAQIDEDRAEWVPLLVDLGSGQKRVAPKHEAFSRRHVNDLRLAGATKEQVLDYVRVHFGVRAAAHLATDLDSYGPWEG